MSDLLGAVRRSSLALAAYNAGPGAGRRLRLRARRIPETQAYVARILGLIDGAGATLAGAARARGAAGRVRVSLGRDSRQASSVAKLAARLREVGRSQPQR